MQNEIHDTTKPAELPTLPRSNHLLAPDTWERDLKEAAGQSDPAINRALSAQRSMIDALGALEQVRKTRNPVDTPAAHINRAAKSYEKMLGVAARHHDNAMDAIRARKRDIDSEINRRLGLEQSQDAAEIRQALRSMKPDERSAAVQKAIDTKDGAVLNAVFNGRQLTTGIGEVQRESFRRRAQEAHAPDLLQLRTALDKSDEMVRGAFDSMLDMAPFAAGTPEVQSEFERRAAAADEALAAFNRQIG